MVNGDGDGAPSTLSTSCTISTSARFSDFSTWKRMPTTTTPSLWLGVASRFRRGAVANRPARSWCCWYWTWGIAASVLIQVRGNALRVLRLSSSATNSNPAKMTLGNVTWLFGCTVPRMAWLVVNVKALVKWLLTFRVMVCSGDPSTRASSLHVHMTKRVTKRSRSCNKRPQPADNDVVKSWHCDIRASIFTTSARNASPTSVARLMRVRPSSETLRSRES